LPSLDENVTCCGFPMGGSQISVTRGVVSRIDVDSQHVLRIQIDAAINPGNSGGPVFDEHGDVVGVASAHLRAASNIGYIIPGKIVELFLNMSQEPKHVPGIPTLAILGSQNLESKALRRTLGLEDLDGGVRKSTDDTSKGDKLKANDVLLAIDGIPIGYDGTIQLSATRPDERINFRSLVTCQRVGSKVLLDVLRDKQRKELEVVLDTCQFLVPQYDGFDACPLYTVCGGCVFSPLTVPLISEKKSNKISSFSQYFRKQRTGNEQLLVLHKVLNDEVNVGYHGWRNMILKSVNGYTPKNIQELVDIIVRKVKGKTVEFHVQSMESEDADWIICMDTQEVLDAEQRILYRHMIASWTSTDAISRELRDAIEEGESSEAEKSVCYNTMCGMRKALGKKEKDEEK
ncbi:trypsin-like serine protease, partial [Thalassiosira pseudonana CCMP1335]